MPLRARSSVFGSRGGRPVILALWIARKITPVQLAGIRPDTIAGESR